MKKSTNLVIAFLSVILMMVSFVQMAQADLPKPGMVIDPENTALVITDPQNDFLSPKGVAWGVV